MVQFIVSLVFEDSRLLRIRRVCGSFVAFRCFEVLDGEASGFYRNNNLFDFTFLSPICVHQLKRRRQMLARWCEEVVLMHDAVAI